MVELKFDKTYNDFISFLEDSTDSIYKAIFNEFKNINETGKVMIYVQGHVNTTKFDTTLIYTKDDRYLLKDFILPHYEKMEEYETCSEIMKIYNSLN